VPNFICLRSYLVLLFLALGVSCAIGFGQATAPVQTNPSGPAIAPGRPAAKVELPALPEMWVKLPARLDFEKLKVGETVDAVVAQGWVYRTCGVNSGAHLAGEVVAFRAWSDSDRSTEAAIAFTAVCQNKDTVLLILIALYSPTEDGKSNMELVNSMPQASARALMAGQLAIPERCHRFHRPVPATKSSPSPISERSRDCTAFRWAWPRAPTVQPSSRLQIGNSDWM